MRLAIVNLKGGTGKTTTAVNLSAYLAIQGHKTLLVDMDPLADATIYTGYEPGSLRSSMVDVVFENEKLENILINTNTPNLDIAPSEIEMSNADLILAAVKGRETILRNALDELDDRYDFIVLDTPSSLNLLLVNCLMAATHLIIPTVPSFLSIRGLKYLTNVLMTLKNNMNHELAVLGILLTIVDSRTRAIQEVVDRLREKFGIKVFDTVIKRSVGLIECPSFGQTIFEYDEESLGARCFRDLGTEIMQKIDGTNPAAGENNTG